MPNDILDSIRQKYPVYADVEDETLARGIAAKYPVYAPHLQQYLSNTSPPQDEPQTADPSLAGQAAKNIAAGMGQEQIGKTSGPGILGAAGALAKNVGGRLAEAGKSAVEGISNIGPAMMEPRDPFSGLAAGANAALNVPAQALRIGSAIPGAASEEIMKSAGLPPEQAKRAGDLAEQATQLLTAGKMTAEHAAIVRDPETGTLVEKNPLAAPADQKAAAAELAEMKNKPPTPVNPELPVSKITETAEGPKIELSPDAGPAERLHEIQHALADEGKGAEPAEGAQAKQYADATVQPPPLGLEKTQQTRNPMRASVQQQLYDEANQNAISKANEGSPADRLKLWVAAGKEKNISEDEIWRAFKENEEKRAQLLELKEPDMGTVGAAVNLRAEPISGELGNASVTEPAGRPGMLPPEVSQTTMRATSAEPILDDYFKQVTSGAIRHDPDIATVLQVQNAIRAGRLSPELYQRELANHGMDTKDLATNFGLSFSDAGRLEQKASALTARLKEAGIEIHGTDLSPDEWVASSLHRLERLGQSTAVVGVMKQARNLASHYILSGPAQSVDIALRAAMQQTMETLTGREIDPMERVHLADAWENLMTVSKSYSGGARAIVKPLLEAFPTQYHRLYGQMLGDIGTGDTGGGILGGAQRMMDVLNTATRVGNELVRSGSFKARADLMLRQRGYVNGLADFPDASAIPKDVIDQSVTTSTKNSMGYDPRTIGESKSWGYKPGALEQASAHVIDAFNAVPGSRLIVKFPRFVYNAISTGYDWSPLGYLELLSKENRAAVAAGDYASISKAIIGTGLVAGFAAIDKAYGTGKPMEYKIGDKNISLAPYHPAAMPALYGYGLNVIKGDRPYGGKDAVREALNTMPDFRAGPVKIAADVIHGAEGSSDAQTHRANLLALQAGGQLIAGFLTPLNELMNMPFDLVEPKQNVKLTTSGNATKSFLGPIEEKVPGLRNELPNKYSPTNIENPRMPELGHMKPTNPAEDELKRLGMNVMVHGTGSPEFDNTIAKYMGPLIQDKMSLVVRSPEYRGGTDSYKKEALTQMLTKIRTIAAKSAAAEKPELAQAVKIQRVPAAKANLAKEQNPDFAKMQADAQAQIANQ